MQLGRSFHSTEPLYLKLFLPYVIVLNEGASMFFFRKLCPMIDGTTSYYILGTLFVGTSQYYNCSTRYFVC